MSVAIAPTRNAKTDGAAKLTLSARARRATVDFAICMASACLRISAPTSNGTDDGLDSDWVTGTIVGIAAIDGVVMLLKSRKSDKIRSVPKQKHYPVPGAFLKS